MQSNQGLTLDRYLEKKPRMEPVQAAKIVLKVAGQLASAAGSMLIHPGRILCARDGSVTLLPPPAEELSLPAVVEYPAYASPEEIRGAEADERSGLYSIGCTLYHMLAGEPPYSSSDPKKVLHAQLESPVPDVRTKAPEVPAGLADLVSELLTKDPEMRVQTASELSRRLKQCVLQAQSSGAAAASPVKTQPRPATPPPLPAATPRAAVNAPAKAPLRPAAAKSSSLTGAARPPSGKPGAVPASPGSKSGGPGSGKVGASARSPGLSLSRQPGSREIGSPRLGSKPVGGPQSPGSKSRGRESMDDDLALEEELQSPDVNRRKAYPFTIGGGILGFILGLVLVSKAGERKAVQVQQDSEQMASQRAQAIADSKKKPGARDAALLKEASQFVEGRLGKRPPAEQQVVLEGSLHKYAQDNPHSHLLVDAYLKVWALASSESAADVDEAEKAYAVQKAEAEKLHGEGKLGLAYNRIYADYNTHKARHGAEIDELMGRWEKEIVEKGDGALAEAQRHGVEGDSEKALDVLRKGLDAVEGDEKLTKTIREQILRINEISALQAASAGKSAKSLDEEGKDGAAEAEKPAEPDSKPEKGADAGGDAGADGK